MSCYVTLKRSLKEEELVFSYSLKIILLREVCKSFFRLYTVLRKKRVLCVTLIAKTTLLFRITRRQSPSILVSLIRKKRKNDIPKYLHHKNFDSSQSNQSYKFILSTNPMTPKYKRQNTNQYHLYDIDLNHSFITTSIYLYYQFEFDHRGRDSDEGGLLRFKSKEAQNSKFLLHSWRRKKI